MTNGAIHQATPDQETVPGVADESSYPAPYQAIDELSAQLREERDTIDVIRRGDVDSLVIGPPGAEQIFSVTSADRPYRLVVESMGEGAATLSAAGRIIYANPRLGRLAGRSGGELIGLHVMDLIAPARRVECGELLMVRTDESARGTSDMISADGSVVPVSVSVSGFELDGNLMRCVIVTDLTRQVEIEQELAGRAEALERTNTELNRSNDDLERFAYAASHDLSEPLRAIAGPLSLLERRYRGHLDTEADQFIKFAVDGCRRMQQLIDSLLAYSRLGTSGRERRDVDCNLIITFVLHSLHGQIEATGGVVDVAPLPTVRADATQLGQVFQNLVSNALKFVAPGVVPHVGIAAIPDASEWRFSVIDNGIGIEPRHRDRVLGMFKRLHGREDYEGTGIGLALVKRIVDNHGGRLGITDAPGGGTCVWFTLPTTDTPVGP